MYVQVLMMPQPELLMYRAKACRVDLLSWIACGVQSPRDLPLEALSQLPGIYRSLRVDGSSHLKSLLLSDCPILPDYSRLRQSNVVTYFIFNIVHVQDRIEYFPGVLVSAWQR